MIQNVPNGIDCLLLCNHDATLSVETVKEGITCILPLCGARSSSAPLSPSFSLHVSICLCLYLFRYPFESFPLVPPVDHCCCACTPCSKRFKYPVRFAWSTDPSLKEHLGVPEDLLPTEDEAEDEDQQEEEEEAKRGGDGDGEHDTPAPEGGREVMDFVVLYKPYDEETAVLKVHGARDGSKKTQRGMAEMMNKMMGVPFREVRVAEAETVDGFTLHLIRPPSALAPPLPCELHALTWRNGGTVAPSMGSSAVCGVSACAAPLCSLVRASCRRVVGS